MAVRNSSENGLWIVCGSYEGCLAGWLLHYQVDSHIASFERVFTDQAHTAPVRCIASSPDHGLLVSGSEDELLGVLDVWRRRKLGHAEGGHEAALTCAALIPSTPGQPASAISGARDGSLALWRAASCGRNASWECVRVLRNHRKPVSDVAVHGSGRIALSISSLEATLRTWNLVRGRQAYALRLTGVPRAVRWTQDGQHFAVLFRERLDLCATSSASTVASWKQLGLACICSMAGNGGTAAGANDWLVLGTDDGKLMLLDSHQYQRREDAPAVLEPVWSGQVAGARVKSLSAAPGGIVVALVTGCPGDAIDSSLIEVYQLEQAPAGAWQLRLLTQQSSLMRLTCVTVLPIEVTAADDDAVADDAAVDESVGAAVTAVRSPQPPQQSNGVGKDKRVLKTKRVKRVKTDDAVADDAAVNGSVVAAVAAVRSPQPPQQSNGAGKDKRVLKTKRAKRVKTDDAIESVQKKKRIKAVA